MRGRKKTPAKVVQLHGNPGKRPINDQEPKFALGIPEPPAFLSETAQKWWNYHVGDLDAAGILARADLGVLASYCTALANLEIAEKQIQIHGYTQETIQAGEKKSPWVLIAKESRDQIRSLGSELGLTAASRARLKAAPRDQDEAKGSRRFLA